MSKNIGGSILPSSRPEIMQPICCGVSELRVVEDPLNYTHHLVCTRGGWATVIASHPNRYACHSLAKRITTLHTGHIKAQAHYIVRCGGKCASAEDIIEIVT